MESLPCRVVCAVKGQEPDWLRDYGLEQKQKEAQEKHSVKVRRQQALRKRLAKAREALQGERGMELDAAEKQQQQEMEDERKKARKVSEDRGRRVGEGRPGRARRDFVGAHYDLSDVGVFRVFVCFVWGVRRGQRRSEAGLRRGRMTRMTTCCPPTTAAAVRAAAAVRTRRTPTGATGRRRRARRWTGSAGRYAHHTGAGGSVMGA